MGTNCPWGPIFWGTICPWGPNGWGPFVQGDQLSWGPFVHGDQMFGDQLSRGTDCLGDHLSMGTKWARTVCSWGPIVGTKCPGTEWVRDQMRSSLKKERIYSKSRKKEFPNKKKNFQIKKEKENNFLLSQSQTLDPSLSGATFRLFLERKTLLQAVLK